jgi:protease I
MAGALDGRRVAILAADGVERVELQQPREAVNPDELRIEPAAVQLVRDFVRSGKPVASICHGPWSLVEADVARGRRLTSWPSGRTDLRNAGAEVVDEEVVTDGNLTTSRSPDDLHACCERIVQEFARAPQATGAGAGGVT